MPAAVHRAAGRRLSAAQDFVDESIGSIFARCGSERCLSGLPGGPHEQPSSPPLYAIEPVLYTMNLSFTAALARAGIEHETCFCGPGFHDWPSYRDAFVWALPGLMRAIAP